jgi:hypothetical protein
VIDRGLRVYIYIDICIIYTIYGRRQWVGSDRVPIHEKAGVSVSRHDTIDPAQQRILPGDHERYTSEW